MSSSQPAAAPTETATTPPDESHQPDQHGPVRLADSVTVIEHGSGDDDAASLDPVRAKALLSEMAVIHEDGPTYTVQEDGNEHTVDREAGTCSCFSTLPERGYRCEHLQRLAELHDRGELPGPPVSTIKPTPADSESPERTTEDGDEEGDGRSITCPECGRDIGQTTAPASEIVHATCNVCALDDHDIYHLETVPGEDPELVYFAEIICTGDAESYYQGDGSMSVYDFFKSHPKVEPNDTVVRVHRRLSAPNCSGLLFSSDTTPVPGSVLTKAVEKLHEPPNAEDAATVESDETKEDDVAVVTSESTGSASDPVSPSP